MQRRRGGAALAVDGAEDVKVARVRGRPCASPDPRNHSFLGVGEAPSSAPAPAASGAFSASAATLAAAVAVAAATLPLSSPPRLAAIRS
jgi:hypothetical protein